MLQTPVNRRKLLALLLLMMSAPGLTYLAAQNAGSQVSTDIITSIPALEDPNKIPSEVNHHVAGYALITVGLLVIGGHAFPRLRSLRFVWPALFLFAGVFLAAWSDSEIWPRGNLSWGWLLHHDPEARQHKIYAIMLIAMGVLEYLRARGRLHHWWRTLAFPLLAVAGCGLLLIHDHGHGSGVRSPEVRAYLINPALDPDGRPDPANDVDPNATMPHDPPTVDNLYASIPDRTDHAMMNMDHAEMETDLGAPHASAATPHSHMTPGMELIAHQHFWFMAVGFAIAAFKLIDDSRCSRHWLVSQSWPSCMVVLGVLLVLYRE